MDFYLEPSSLKNKKYSVKYLNPNTDKINTIHFGLKGASDFLHHKDEQRKQRYIMRHSGMGEKWNEPTTAGFWSRWLLWEKPTLKEAINNIEKKFNINIEQP